MNQDKYISADNDPLQTSVFIAAQSQINSEFQRHRDEWITNQEAIGDELKELTLIMAHLKALQFGLDHLKLWLTYQLRRYQVRHHIMADLKTITVLQAEAERTSNQKWAQVLNDWEQMERRHLKKL